MSVCPASIPAAMLAIDTQTVNLFIYRVVLS